MKYLSFLFCLATFVARSQEVKFPINNDGEVEYTEVIQVDSASSSKLFSNARLFITDAFVSGKSVTQLADEAGKTLVAKGWMSVDVAKILGFVYPGKVNFSITIRTKEGRYKYSFTDFDLEYQSDAYSLLRHHKLNAREHKNISKKQWESVQIQADLRVRALITKLKADMQKDSKGNDW